jgi:hypothetical protein
MVRENESLTEVGLLMFDNDAEQLLQRIWTLDGAPAKAILTLGISIGDSKVLTGGSVDDLMEGAHRGKLHLAGPVELAYVESKADKYPGLVRQALKTAEALDNAQAEDPSVADEPEAGFDQAGTTVAPLRNQLIWTRDTLVQKRDEGWGDPTTLEQLVDEAQNSIETAAGELGIASESETMRTIKVACGALWQGTQLLKTDGPGSAKASVKLSAGIKGLDQAMRQL